MSTPLPPDDPFFSSYMRVIRGKETRQYLTEVFPTLEEKALSSPPTLTDLERRQLADLPDADEEAENIRNVTSRSREDLLSTAFSNASLLSDDEAQLVSRRFWSPRTLQESSEKSSALLKEVKTTVKRVWRAREAGSLPNEFRSFTLASAEVWRREQQRRDEEQSQFGAANRPVIPAWMDRLAQRFKEERDLNTWGFIALIDAEAQQSMSAERRSLLIGSIPPIFRQSMRNNGAYAKLLNRTWKIIFFNAPTTATVSLEPDADHSAFRQAFRSLLDRDDTYPGPPGPDPRKPSEKLRNRRGFLTNTFLVLNKTSVDSILDQRYWDDMRVLAFEADFPQPGRAYAEGYRGWTWVRLEQLAYRFYGARLNENLGMDEIWKAAQGSKHGAFAALDPDVAKVWTRTTGMSGPREPFYGVE